LSTIIDSLFLELGIDVSKFSKDQQSALAKIAQFEAQAKRSGKGAGDAIKTVGDAFRDLAKDSRIGRSADGIDNLAKKFKDLGVSMSAAGGAGTAVGGMAKGLGMLLSPASLGIAALGMLGKETWDFNRDMTSLNATLARNAELSNMSTSSLWAMGQAAKTVGGDPAAVQAGIAGLQTSLAGMAIGVGSAVPQMIGMARLRRYGARFNPGGFGKGADEESLFKAVNAYYQQHGRAATMALVTGYGLMSADQANLAMSPGGWDEYKKAQAKAQAMKTGGGFENVVRESLKNQAGLGEADIAGSIAAETAYGGIQQPMQTIVGLLTDIRTFLSSLVGYVVQIAQKFVGNGTGGIKELFTGADDATISNILGTSLPKSAADRMALGKKMLMGFGMSEKAAAAAIGNQMQESSMDPMAFNGSHRGIGQWDKTRSAAFAKRFGYEIGSFAVSPFQQFSDQERFTAEEPQMRAAAAAMAKAQTLMGKTSAFMRLDEVVNDGSLARRFMYASQALHARAIANNNDNRSEVRIGDIHVHTNATDPAAHADAVRRGLGTHPLLSSTAQGTVALATRANN
jgi:hypothetical protein